MSSQNRPPDRRHGGRSGRGHRPDSTHPDARHRSLGLCGADGLMIEVHVRPEVAYSDGIQSLKPAIFRQLMQEIAPFFEPTRRRL